MKTILSSILLLSLTSLVQAHTVNLAWDLNDPAESITGYRVYQKVTTTTSGSSSPVITWKLLGETPGNVTKFAVKDIPSGITTFTVSAFNAYGESDKSAELTTSIILPPKGLKVTSVNIVVEPAK